VSRSLVGTVSELNFSHPLIPSWTDSTVLTRSLTWLPA